MLGLHREFADRHVFDHPGVPDMLLRRAAAADHRLKPTAILRP